jgi:ABC-type glycerol-3-phosphate transport system substrate-binding protein
MIKWLTSPEQAARYWDTLRVAPPASLSVIRSDAFRSTHGIPREGHPSEFEVLPLPRELFQDRAAWILHAYEPASSGSKAPGFVPTGLYQRILEDEIARMLQEYLRSPNTGSAQAALDRAASNVRAAIERDRARER